MVVVGKNSEKMKNCSKKEQNCKKENLSSRECVQAWRKWKIRRVSQVKSPHPGKSPAYDIKKILNWETEHRKIGTYKT
jgi:hypothetical protein